MGNAGMAPTWELPGGERTKEASLDVLAFRVDTLTKEKEAVERDLREERQARIRQAEAEAEERRKLSDRIATMEGYVQSGKGFMLSITIIGAALGFAATYWKSIFGPWMGKP
jgi:hypothetical protein